MKDILNDRYYSKKNRSVIKAAPAATAHSLKSKQHVQKLIDEQAPKLTLYETSYHEDHDSGGGEIDIIQLKTRDFNRKLQVEKENINLWLDFVDFQDEVFAEQVEKAENGKNISVKTLNERKIAILERALDENQEICAKFSVFFF